MAELQTWMKSAKKLVDWELIPKLWPYSPRGESGLIIIMTCFPANRWQHGLDMNSPPMWQQHRFRLEQRIVPHVLRTIFMNLHLIQYFLKWAQSYQLCKWFEPRSISSSYSVIVWVSVVLKRTVVGDCCSFRITPTTVLFRTTLTRTITLYELLSTLYNVFCSPKMTSPLKSNDSLKVTRL